MIHGGISVGNRRIFFGYLDLGEFGVCGGDGDRIWGFWILLLRRLKKYYLVLAEKSNGKTVDKDLWRK